MNALQTMSLEELINLRNELNASESHTSYQKFELVDKEYQKRMTVGNFELPEEFGMVVKSTVLPGIYRYKIERSCMINNDDNYIYKSKLIPYANAKKEFPSPGFLNDTRMMMRRPVFRMETFQFHLNTPYQCSYTTTPDITLLLDELFCMHKYLKSFRDAWKEAGWSDEKIRNERAQVLAMHIGSVYYDCMSGGMDKYDGMLCKSLCSHFSEEELNTRVYPKPMEPDDDGKDEWYTLKDWTTQWETSLDSNNLLKDTLIVSHHLLPEFI